MAIYDTLGATYGRTRRPDPRIAAQIHTALGNAADVVNVGAGTGSYEPPRTLLAIEPSDVMLAQRPPRSAPAVRAVAEHLPLRDNAADAVMALLTIHHWTDLASGIAELRRVARRRIVILTWNQRIFSEQFWLVRDYLPQAAAFDDTRAVPIEQLVALLGGARQEPVPIPYDCTDGFGAAYWRRPHAYLDPQVRAGISMLAQTPADALAPGLAALTDDLATGRWHHHHADLLALDSIDVGYRLLVTDL
ncbi:MerR family transcriptional regulator [Streptomyces sp. MMG1533]|uniref:methyltransferase domain-containing protein n=1 Tax=Streptomyces sp. MMG1533 TaxID=1415546 RepID=UPI0006AE67B7|nr:methyltransferase domain-containing protein [Streptomyces sp. MMG1533]KOU73244.1 MerR family transcriptional regulator [Streptomyces sp. MMG1533]